MTGLETRFNPRLRAPWTASRGVMERGGECGVMLPSSSVHLASAGESPEHRHEPSHGPKD